MYEESREKKLQIVQYGGSLALEVRSSREGQVKLRPQEQGGTRPATLKGPDPEGGKQEFLNSSQNSLWYL